jgi:hypothetical protein
MLKVLVVCLAIAVPAQAFAVINQAVRDACHKDYVTHCNGMTVPSDEVRSCMRAHSLQLSNPCLQALVDNKEATKADVDKYLEGTRKGK